MGSGLTRDGDKIGLWFSSRLIGNSFSFLKSKIKDEGESGVLGEASLVLRLSGVVKELSSER